MLITSTEYKVIKYFIIIMSVLYLIRSVHILYYLTSYSNDEIIKRIFDNKNIDDIQITDHLIYDLIKQNNINCNNINQLKHKINRYKILLYTVSIITLILSILFLVYILNYKNLSINSKSLMKRILIVFLVLSILFNTGFLLVKSIREIVNIIFCLFIIAFLNSK